MNTRHAVVAGRPCVSNFLRYPRRAQSDGSRRLAKSHSQLNYAVVVTANDEKLTREVVEHRDPERDQGDDNYREISCKVEQLVHGVHVTSLVLLGTRAALCKSPAYQREEA